MNINCIAIETCLFDLEHDGLWKAMEPRLIDSLTHVSPIPLIPSSIHPFSTAEELETKLKSLITSKRRRMSTSTGTINKILLLKSRI